MAVILLKYQSFRFVPSIPCVKCICITFAITNNILSQIYQITIIWNNLSSIISNNTVETNGDFSPASMMGNVSVGTDAILVERVKHLEELLAEKERLIKVYEKLVEGKK